MQAEMFDSMVSSNSQELSSVSASSALKLFENPQFRVRVIMRCAEPWFVAKDVATSIEYDQTSINKMCKLCRDRDVAIVNGKEYSDDLSEYSEGRGNPNITVISEHGLYRIFAKCNLPKCEPFESWVFDAVLPSIRKTGSYSVTQPTLAIPKTLPEALRAYADEVERREAAEKRAITAEADLTSEKEAHEKDNKDFQTGFDIINAQKAQIGSNREATAMATASAKSRECKRLTAENEELKDAVGRGMNWHTVNMMTAEWKREFGHAPDWRQLKKFSADFPKEMKPVKDVEVKVVLPNGSEKVNKLFRYHRKAWAKYRESEENRRAKDKNVPDTKILDLSATDAEVEYF